MDQVKQRARRWSRRLGGEAKGHEVEQRARRMSRRLGGRAEGLEAECAFLAYKKSTHLFVKCFLTFNLLFMESNVLTAMVLNSA